MSFAAAFQALTRTVHSSARPMRLASSKGAWAYHSSPVGAGRTFVASASIRRPSASKALDGSQPVSRSMAARYSASRARAAPRSPARYRASIVNRAASSESRSNASQPSARSAASRHRRWSMASRMSAARTPAYRRMRPDLVSATHSSNCGAFRVENPAKNRGISIAAAASGSDSARRRNSVTSQRTGSASRTIRRSEVHQASEGVTQLLQRLTQ